MGLNGAIANGWTLNVYNSIILGNDGGGVVDFISWAESKIRYSLVQDVIEDNVNHNLSDDTDPAFTNGTSGDYHLNPGSPCIDKGDDSSYQGSGGNLQTDSDLGGTSRHQGMSIDMGAYEGSNITDNIGSTKPEIYQWHIGPNPTYGLVNIFKSGNGRAPSTITLSDAYGRFIKTIPIRRKVQQISLAEFGNGLYFITTENGERFKIVKR